MPAEKETYLIVTSIDEINATVASHSPQNSHLVVQEGTTEILGVGMISGLYQYVQTTHPNWSFIIDCGHNAGHVLACLRHGIPCCFFSGKEISKLQQISEAYGAKVMRPPAWIQEKD